MTLDAVIAIGLSVIAFVVWSLSFLGKRRGVEVVAKPTPREWTTVVDEATSPAERDLAEDAEDIEEALESDDPLGELVELGNRRRR